MNHLPFSSLQLRDLGLLDICHLWRGTESYAMSLTQPFSKPKDLLS